jgi:hypothetical protein
MLQDPSLGLCSAQTSGSSVTLISAIAAASALGDAELERVKTRLGPSQAPAIAHKQPNTEATPLAPTTDGPTSVGAGNSIDGGRPRARRLDRKATGTAGPTVPTTSMTDHPVDRVRGRKVVTIGTTPESSSMLQDPSLGLCSAQTSGSSVTLISAIAAASALGDAELERVKTRLGPSQAPAIAHKQPNTEATPLAPTTDGLTSVGAGNSIDGGRPRARRLDIDREAQAEENEEDEEEVEATKEEDSPAPSEDLGTPRSTGTGARQTGRVRPRARLASRPPPTRTHSRPTRRTPRKLRTPHKDDATEADTPNGTPTTTRTDE